MEKKKSSVIETIDCKDIYKDVTDILCGYMCNKCIYNIGNGYYLDASCSDCSDIVKEIFCTDETNRNIINRFNYVLYGSKNKLLILNTIANYTIEINTSDNTVVYHTKDKDNKDNYKPIDIDISIYYPLKNSNIVEFIYELYNQIVKVLRNL